MYRRGTRPAPGSSRARTRRRRSGGCRPGPRLRAGWPRWACRRCGSRWRRASSVSASMASANFNRAAARARRRRRPARRRRRRPPCTARSTSSGRSTRPPSASSAPVAGSITGSVRPSAAARPLPADEVPGLIACSDRRPWACDHRRAARRAQGFRCRRVNRRRIPLRRPAARANVGIGWGEGDGSHVSEPAPGGHADGPDGSWRRRRHRARPRDARVRQLRRGRGRRLRHPPGRVLLDARPVGLRQDHDAADDRRVRGARRRRDAARGPRRLAGAAVPAQRQHRVPAVRAVPAHERVRQRRLRARAAGRSADAEMRPAVDGDARGRAARPTSPSAGRRSSRAASSSGSRWPARW